MLTSQPRNPPTLKSIKTPQIGPKKSDSQYLTQWLELLYSERERASKKADFLTPKKNTNGKYITNEATLNPWIDPRIFIETQVKRLLRWLCFKPFLISNVMHWICITLAGMKLAYYELNEDKVLNKIYKNEVSEISFSDVEDGFLVHNLGHASQLIQTCGMNILTDPVFGDLAPIFYPSKTNHEGYAVKAKHLPKLDVILISHNHRDHVDADSLKKILDKCKEQGLKQPTLLVPKGDESFFSKLGFNTVYGFEWHDAITLESGNQSPVTFVSTPADHRSGRTINDSHNSLVTGWCISPENQKEIVYFAGDTARLNDTRVDALALNIYLMMNQKNGLDEKTLPAIINLEPGGPNYTRKDMQPTHQSGVDSIVSAFRLAIAINKINKLDPNRSSVFTNEQWLDSIATVFMHHNRFELGPDRFNENVFIYTRLLSYLAMDNEELKQHKEKQLRKPTYSSLFHHRKDFIIEGVYHLRALAKEIWPDLSPKEQQDKLIGFIKSRTHFPLINEKFNTKALYATNYGEESMFIPNTWVDGGNRRKGEKLIFQP